MILERKYIKAEIGMMSLVGVIGEFPYSFGNYFSFANGCRCVNMWAENLQHLIDTGVIDDKQILVDVYDGYWVVVVDDRVNHCVFGERPCFTGGRVPYQDILVTMHKLYGWDYHETVEKHVDPVSYYADKENMEYDPDTGIVRQHVNAKSRKLPDGWRMEIEDDFSAMNIPNGEIE